MSKTTQPHIPRPTAINLHLSQVLIRGCLRGILVMLTLTDPDPNPNPDPNANPNPNPNPNPNQKAWTHTCSSARRSWLRGCQPAQSATCSPSVK